MPISYSIKGKSIIQSLSCFPNRSQSIISILTISEFKDFIGILKYSSHTGFNDLSIFLLFTSNLVFNIENRQYGSLNPFESDVGRFVALNKCTLNSQNSLREKFSFSSITSPTKAGHPVSVIFISIFIFPVILPLFLTSIHFLYIFPGWNSFNFNSTAPISSFVNLSLSFKNILNISVW